MLNAACSTTPVAMGCRLTATISESRNGLAAILTPADLLLDLDVPTKTRALQEIARLVGARHGLAERKVYASLVGREEVGSTGLGCGVAVPHARIPGIADPVTVYARMKAPVDFAAPDRKRVPELFVILVPADGAEDRNLLLLALIAEAFSDREFRARLAAASDASDVRSTFAQWISDKRVVATEDSSA